MANLISDTRAKQNIFLTTFTAAENAQVVALLASVSALVRSFTKRDFGIEEYSEEVNGGGTDLLILKQYPIVSVTSVTFIGFGGDQLVTGHTIDLAQGMLFRRDSLWNEGYKNYRVVYRAGYAVIPEDLQEVCAQWLSALFWQTKDNAGRGPKLPTESMRRVLSLYRRTTI